MRSRIGYDLPAVALLAVALILTVRLLPSSALRIALGIPFVLALPGYSLVAALYPRRRAIDGVHRLALSLGLSLAVVALVSLALNHLPPGITQESVLSSNAAFILVMSAIAWGRRRRLPEAEKADLRLTLQMPRWGGTWRGKALSALLAASVVGATVTAGYAIAQPQIGERFTEFYILGNGSGPDDYPRILKPGQSADVRVGIANRERENVAYRLKVTVNGVQVGENTVELAHNETWEQPVSFAPQSAGAHQSVEFSLYRDGGPEPYLNPLRLWIDVLE